MDANKAKVLEIDTLKIISGIFWILGAVFSLLSALESYKHDSQSS